jgi:hypothetical protein
MGTLLTEQSSIHKLSLGDNVEEYTGSVFCWTVKIVTIYEEMFQPNIYDH